MSDHGTASHDTSAPTPSAGISWMIYVFLAVSLIVIFWQGSNVVTSSKAGKYFPSADSTKVELPAPHI
jgi:hypothetical protein